MIDVQKFREEGYLYDSLENYKNFLDFDNFKKIKDLIDSKNIIRHSRFDYWIKYNELSYAEKLIYDDYLFREKDLPTADFMYLTAHEYQLKKIKECGFYPTWIFGTSMDDDICSTLRNRIISDFQENFSKHYYFEKENLKYMHDLRLQFYNKGCLIDVHDDGKPTDRYCVFLYFLNNEWKDENGGHLILYTKENKKIKIKPTFPNFVVLDSDVNLYHELEEVKDDIKYNIVCFFGKS